jgi:2-methylcitrate dehydratase PrpD
MKIAAREIERIRVGSYRAAKEVSGYESPQTPSEARFSLKYVVATALTHGSVRLAAFEPERMNDGATRELMQRIEVAIDPELDAAFPQQRAARVAIVARDGREEELLQPMRIGDPEAPLSDAQLDEKYLELAVPVLGGAKARALLAKLWKLEAEKTLAA